jgi:2-oxoglutarate/2-oxoacid ferredoxin oxidoreductase subunit alpha
MVDFTWKIAGPAGFGIMSSGLIFSKAFLRAGYHVFDYAEFPSLIRGGHNTHQSRISSLPLHAQARPVHILVSLNREGFSKHANELALGAAVIYDNERIKDAPGKGTPCPVPLAKLAREAGGTDLMANNVAIGASFALLDADMDGLNSVIHDIFGRKGGAVVAANVKAARAGYDYVKKEWKGNFSIKAPKQNSARRMLITGNEALGAGAIAAGCKLYVGYPMTPTSSLLTYMATHAEQFGFVVRQAEDEISVINNAIGAAFAGVRAMVGTAGGGFALMSEGYGCRPATRACDRPADMDRAGRPAVCPARAPGRVSPHCHRSWRCGGGVLLRSACAQHCGKAADACYSADRQVSCRKPLDSGRAGQGHCY